MGEINYAPLIDEMKWSFSRIEAYESCPYRWYLQYIRKCKDKDKFYASYGSFMHRLLEGFYNGELSKAEMLTTFLKDFQKEVKGVRPKESTLKKYIDCGVEYLKSFSPFPYKMISVEKEVTFTIGDKEFKGFIDFEGIDETDGEIVIGDNKSRDLRPRSGRAKPTKKDQELDDVLRQLYLYSVAIEQEYGKLPKGLFLNCFRTGVFIYEPFDKNAYEAAKQWALDQIAKIREDSDFDPILNPFSCFWICGVNDSCTYYLEDKKNKRR